MAISCALVSGTFSFLFTFIWHLFSGGSVGSFFLTYFLLGNALFVVLLALAYLAVVFQHLRHNRAFRTRLPVDRLA